MYSSPNEMYDGTPKVPISFMVPSLVGSLSIARC